MGRPAVGKIAKVGIVVLVLFVVLVAAVVVIIPRGAASTTQTNASITTTATHIASGSGPVSVTVAKTTVDQTTADSQAGDTVYIYDVTLTGNDSSSHPSNASYFALTGDSGTAYSTANATALKQQLPVEMLSMDQQASGQIAFQVPDNDLPAKLEYKVPAQGGYVDTIVTNLPQPSRWVSSVTKADATMPSNSATSNYFLTTTIQNATTGLYYSTDIIPVKIEISPYNYDDIVNSNVPTITITSITVSTQGFSIVDISPALPLTISANGNLATVDINVNVKLPSASVNVQTLELTLTTT